jgi:putative transposase
LAGRHPRWGYRMVWASLKREGWRINRKRVYRLWRREGLRVPRKARKKRRLGSSENSCLRSRAEYKDHVWAWDFIHDRTATGSPLKCLSIIDEYTRECLELEVARSIKSADVIDVLTGLFRRRGVPRHIRSDNGPEFIAGEIRGWLSRSSVETLYVEPGSPWENGYAEAFGSRLRDEFLNVEEFADVREAKALASAWQEWYNSERPHSSLGYRTPEEFATTCVPSGLGSLGPSEHTRQENSLTLIATGT